MMLRLVWKMLKQAEGALWEQRIAGFRFDCEFGETITKRNKEALNFMLHEFLRLRLPTIQPKI